MFDLFGNLSRYRPGDPAMETYKSTTTTYTTPSVPANIEPKGLGAVVRDANGDTWTRADRGTLPWFRTRADGNGGATDWGRWGLDFTPVEILAPGVPVYKDNV